MKSIQIPIILLFATYWFVAHSALSQSDGIGALLNGDTEQAISTAEQVPSPLDLHPNWWRYFDDDSDELKKKIDLFLDLLDGLSSDVSEVDLIKGKDLISLINSNLNQIIAIHTAESITAFEKSPFKDAYTLDMILELARLHRELETSHQIQFDAFEKEQITAKETDRIADSLMDEYQKLDVSSSKKLLLGVEIIATKLSWLVSIKSNPHQKKQLEVLNKRIKFFEDEIEFALKNITITEDKIDEIKNQIENQQTALTKSQQLFIQEKNKTIGIYNNDEVSAFNFKLLSQRALLAEIQTILDELNLNFLELKLSIAQIIKHKKEVTTRIALAKFEEIDLLIRDVESQSSQWLTILKNEYDILNNYDPGPNKDLNYIIQLRKNTAKKIGVLFRDYETALRDLEFLNHTYFNLIRDAKGPVFYLLAISKFTVNEIWYFISNIFNKSLFSISDVPVTSVDIIRAIFIVLIAYIISRVVRRVLTTITESRLTQSASVFYTLSRLSHYLIIVIGIILALASIGLNFTNLAIVAGALSVGIGFGLQSIVNNFVSGIIILFEQNLKVGDYVELESGMKGVVQGIHVRSTVIRTLDNLDIIVPNSELVSAKVTNYTMNEKMFRLHVSFGVAYGSDEDLVEKAGLEAARKVEVTYDDGARRRPQVWLVDFGDSSLNYELIVWVVNKPGNHATPGSWKALYMKEIHRGLKKYGVVIPFPQRDVHLIN